MSDTAVAVLRTFHEAGHGKSRFLGHLLRAIQMPGRGLGEGVPDFPDWTLRLTQVPRLPRDPRGIVLLCGYIAAAAFGLGTVFAVGDPIGWAYLLLAIVGFLFLETRGLSCFLWLVVAAGGALLGASGNASGWIELVLGGTLAGIALMPVRAEGVILLKEIAARPSVVIAAPRAPDPTAPFHSVSDEELLHGTRPVALAETITNGAASSPATAARVGVSALGHLQLTGSNGEPLRPLEPRLQFLLSFLIARYVAGQQSISRASLAEEIAPGFSATAQRDRLRKQLYELQSADADLAAAINVERGEVSFNLSAADSDALSIVHTAAVVKNTNDLIDSATASTAQTDLESSRREFLAGFEDLEQQVTQGRGTAGDTVRAARQVIFAARADIALAYAEYQLAAGRVELAIPYLVDVLQTTPERQDVARLLVAAYLQTGQIARAREARREYDLIEEN